MGISPATIKGPIDSVRRQIGRMVTFNVPSDSSSLTQLYNPATDNRFRLTHRKVEVLARIHFTNDEAVTATPGGKYYIGESYVVVDPSDLPTAQATQEQGGFVTVDNRNFEISKIIPVGAPSINRYRLILIGMGNRPN